MHFTNAKLNPRFRIVGWNGVPRAKQWHVDTAALRAARGSAAPATTLRFTWENLMIGIVRLALRRPYTFVVMAVLFLIFGPAAALRTPPHIFPNIKIPLITAGFSYTRLPSDDMAGPLL